MSRAVAQTFGQSLPSRCRSPAFDANVVGLGYTRASIQSCDEATCQVRHMMLEVRHAIANVLDNRSLAEMRDAANDDVAALLKYHA